MLIMAILSTFYLEEQQEDGFPDRSSKLWIFQRIFDLRLP